MHGTTLRDLVNEDKDSRRKGVFIFLDLALVALWRTTVTRLLHGEIQVKCEMN